MSFSLLLGASLPSYSWGEENSFSKKSSSTSASLLSPSFDFISTRRCREAWVGEKGRVNVGSTFQQAPWEGVWFFILRMCNTECIFCQLQDSYRGKTGLATQHHPFMLQGITCSKKGKVIERSNEYSPWQWPRKW